MRGALGLFGLADLLQLFARNNARGVLVVAHPEGGEARLYLGGGRLLHAVYKDLTDLEALRALLADERGRFEFRPGLAPSAETIGVGLGNLLLEAAGSQGAAGAPAPPRPEPSPRTVRLVAGVDRDLEGLVVRLDEIVARAWNPGGPPVPRVRVRGPGGREEVFALAPSPGLGASLLFSSVALLRFGARAGDPVLVRPEPA